MKLLYRIKVMATHKLINKYSVVFETGIVDEDGATFTVTLSDGKQKVYNLIKNKDNEDKWDIDMENGTVDDKGPFTIVALEPEPGAGAMEFDGGSRKKSKKSKSKRKTKGGKKQKKQFKSRKQKQRR